MDYNEKSIELHKKHQGKLEIKSKVSIVNQDDLSTAYSPGVAAPCLEIEKDESKYDVYTSAAHTVAVITDGTAVLGLGDIGPKAAMPVMEGKAILFKKFANIDAFPIVVDTKDPKEFIQTVKNIAKSFGGINLEDISAPRCFEIEDTLKEELDIPVFHDDQHGTAIVTLAGIINYLKLTNKKKEEVKIIINGSGAAGGAIMKLLKDFGCPQIILCDRKGAISKQRKDLSESKKGLLSLTNPKDESGSVHDVIKSADIFIGVSAGNVLKAIDIKNMNKDPAIFAMANPTPEINPDIALKAGALVVGTGRSDYPNQLNNVLVFPGIFRGALQAKAKAITCKMKLTAAIALAAIVEKPTPQKIIPSPFDAAVAKVIAKAVIDTVEEQRKGGRKI